MEATKEKMEATKIWLNEKEVSELTGIAVQTLRNDRHLCKGFPYYRWRRSIRYKRNDITDGMEVCRIVPGQSFEAR